MPLSGWAEGGEVGNAAAGLVEGRVERGAEGGVAANHGFPRELDALAAPLEDELEAERRDGEGVFVVVDLELTADRRGESGGHGILAACAFSSGVAASVCWSPTDFGNPSATRTGRLAAAGTVAIAPRVIPRKVASTR